MLDSAAAHGKTENAARDARPDPAIRAALSEQVTIAMQVHILYATESGTAEFLSEDLEKALAPKATCKVTSLEFFKASEFESDPLYIIVSATFGSGDVPMMAEEFLDTLASGDLSHVTFAVFGLGDTSFGETFNQGSEKLMHAMLERGAKQIGERGIFDASSFQMPEDIAVPWAEGILEQFAATA